MMRPRLEAIYVSASAGCALAKVEACRVIPGAGIDGDRYASRRGTWSSWPQDHEITMVEGELSEVLAAAGMAVEVKDLRRNLVTRDVRLNDLVKQDFIIGKVRLRGTRLCEPCAYLERLLQAPGLTRLLAGRAGLRARILQEGTLFGGDELRRVAVAAETSTV